MVQGKNVPRHVVGRGKAVQKTSGLIGFSGRHEFSEACGGTHHEGQNAGGQRIERTEVANVFFLEQFTGVGHHVMAGATGRFVENENAVHDDLSKNKAEAKTLVTTMNPEFSELKNLTVLILGAMR